MVRRTEGSTDNILEIRVLASLDTLFHSGLGKSNCPVLIRFFMPGEIACPLIPSLEYKRFSGFKSRITSRNNAPISNYGGGFRCKSEYPWCIIEFSKKSRKTKKKMTEKRQFLRKTSFRPNRFFLWSPLKFSIFLRNFFKSVNKKFLDDQKFKFLRNLSKTRKFAILKIWYKVLHKFFFKYLVDKIFLALSNYLHNFFLLAFKVQILTKISQNHEYLQIILLTNHLRSESFFYNLPFHDNQQTFLFHIMVFIYIDYIDYIYAAASSPSTRTYKSQNRKIKNDTSHFEVVQQHNIRNIYRSNITLSANFCPVLMEKHCTTLPLIPSPSTLLDIL
ncbi:hypothetical protein AGLY_015322 [Aphis glycines]|uniref:Uncharacterized protein n=1 Tax=Aphis glycines TaxID=307491 RepID=A0A6G0T0X5_APHGL|nr:hypothetical protein AGLY_015322 [Aphis glycines]